MYLKPLTTLPRPQRFLAFDCEGVGGPDGFVCGSVASDLETVIFEDPQAMLDYLLSRPFRGYWLCAHNLEYDLGVLTGGDLHFLTCLFAGSRLLWAETSDGARHKWKFVDSLNIFPGMKLSDLGEMVGRPKLDLPPEVEAHLRRGGKLSALPPELAQVVRRYNVRDATILYQALSEFQDELLALGGQLRPTISGIALDLFRRKYLDLPFPTLDGDLSHLVRGSYYGARSEPFRLGTVEGVSAYDVNSLYPYVLSSQQFPHPGGLVLDTQPNREHFPLDREGVSMCRVFVPDDSLPLLPARYKNRLFFPTGVFDGIFPHSELRFALGSGVELVDVSWSLWAKSTFNPFETFVSDLYARRKLAASDSPLKQQVYKLILNSLYGRFGVNWEQGLQVLQGVPPDPDWDDFAGSELRLINGYLYALRRQQPESPPFYANVLVSAYTTAGARLHLYNLMKLSEQGLVYVDTDCVFTTGELPTGEGLGLLKLEYDRKRFQVVAPKEYAIFSGDEIVEIHAKGIPRDKRLEYLNTGKVSFDSPLGLMEGFTGKGSVSQWVERLRTRQRVIPKRCPDSARPIRQGSVGTRAWAIEELRLYS